MGPPPTAPQPYPKTEAGCPVTEYKARSVIIPAMSSEAAYPIPHNEARRLAELESLQVSTEEPIPELQGLCEVLAYMSSAPVALVSLVDEHEQIFAANVGLPGVTGTPRNVAFCAHAIMSDALLVVENAEDDPRFAQNPLVTGQPYIQAYAGAPLIMGDDLRVGTLCMIDFQPRPFTAEQLANLKRLSEAAAAILKSHRTQRDLKAELYRAREREKQLRESARRDGLTGLLNTTNFWAAANARLNRTATQEYGALILVDVDNFKMVNDRYGHALGDTYLKTFADVLSGAGKASLPPGSLVGRLGGDEFAVYLHGGVDIAMSARALTAQWREELAAAAQALRKPELGRASIGVALSPDHGDDLETLYQLADVALYAAKENGRNRTVVYNPRLGTHLNLRALRAQLLSALDQGEIVPFYQPKVDLKTGQIAGVEVLSRWHHPKRGLLVPHEFAAAFKDRSVSPQITRSIFLSTLEDMVRWRDLGLPQGRVAINTTVYDLTDARFVPDMDQILHHTGMSWDCITIEVTEAVVMGRRTDQVYASLRDLRSKGARIALDDFGTGYGGLQHFRSWPIDTIKIDRSFICRLPESEEDLRIVRAIIDLAHDFNMLVVGEGIETPAQARCLRDLSCDLAQGYLFGRPMPMADMTTYLGNQNSPQGEDFEQLIRESA